MPKWTNEQQLAIDKEGTNIIVSAGAGSGKTAVLTARVIRKLNNGVDIDTVIKKAYGEEVVTKTREEKREEENKTVDAFKEEETDIKSLTIEQAEIKANEKEVDDKIASIDELLNDTNTDDDFYSLVDSMYKNEEGDKE